VKARGFELDHSGRGQFDLYLLVVSNHSAILESKLDTKSGQQREEPGEGIILFLPVAAMFALIGVLALLMRSTGKW